MTSQISKKFLFLSCWIILFILIWQSMITLFDFPDYILPAPKDVGQVFVEDYVTLGQHAYVTSIEVLLSLITGCGCGLLFAFIMLLYPPLQRALNPVFVASQCIPTFAIAPLIILWLGFGVASKVFIASLIVFFPMTTNAYDGLSQTPKEYMYLGQTMNMTTWTAMRYIRIPSALPMIAAGIKVSVVVAPIGAVIGEWAGSSEGLGYYMMYSNSRMEVDGMFAALIILSLGCISLYHITEVILGKVIFWVKVKA